MTGPETISVTKKEFEELKSENASLKHQLAELRRLIFGAKSERFIAQDPAQSTLFDLPEEQNVETKTETITYERRKSQEEKKQPLRTELPAHLERRDEIIEPENIPQGSTKIGEAITEVLEYEPASVYNTPQRQCRSKHDRPPSGKQIC